MNFHHDDLPSHQDNDISDVFDSVEDEVSSYMHQPASPTASGIYVRIKNRHLSCLETTCTSFVPVSHVWDDSIRRANESRSHNDEAAYKLIDSLDALFKGAQDAYESGVEFWHD